MGHGEVEERAGWYGLIGDRFPVGEALHIRPILFEAGRLGCCRRKCHRAAERIRQDLVELPLLAGEYRAVRESDPDRGNLLALAWGLNEGGAEVKEVRPLPRILGTHDLRSGRIQESIGTIPEQPALGDLSTVQFLSHHG